MPVITVKEKTAINSEIQDFLDSEIIPQYLNFDPAHNISHVLSVMKAALEMGRHYGIDRNMLAVAAAFHDLGLIEGRQTHHLVSGRILRESEVLRKWFTREQIETMAQAAEDHRASSDHEPRSIYGKIIAEADRQIDSEKVIKRTIQFSLSHHPQLDKEGHWNRTLAHLHEKYGKDGYLKLWIPESSNANGLKRLREIIDDKARLRCLFEELYEREISGNNV